MREEVRAAMSRLGPRARATTRLRLGHRLDGRELRMHGKMGTGARSRVLAMCSEGGAVRLASDSRKLPSRARVATTLELPIFHRVGWPR